MTVFYRYGDRSTDPLDPAEGGWVPTFDVEARPEMVPQARARVRGMLEEWGAGHLREDVDLVLTELLGNVVLHAPGPTRIAVERDQSGVLLEVRDGSQTHPVRRSAALAATTGRGLNLVAAICSGWGVRNRDDDRPGKTVWCVIPHVAQDEVVPDLDVDALLASYGDREDLHEEVEVRVGEAPVGLMVAAKDHLDSVLRELTLAEGGGGLPAEVVEPMVRAVRRFGPARAQLRAQLSAAMARGDSRVQLTFRLPVELADVGEQYLRVLERADAFARDRRLLSLESAVEHRVLREWYVHSLVRGLRQVAAGVPQVPGRTFEERLLQELHALEQSKRVAEMGALLQQVTARLATAEGVGQIGQIAVAEGVAALAAAGGSLTRSDAGVTVVVTEVGDDIAVGARYVDHPLPVRPTGPSSEVLRTGQAVWVQGREDRDARFPHLAVMQPSAIAIAVVPLRAGSEVVGALRLTWPEPRVFSDAERLFLDGLAVQTGQALARADALSELHALRSELDLLLSARGPISSTDLAVLRTLYEDPPVGIAVIGADRRYRRVNAFLARVNGRSASEHVGQLVADVVARQLAPDQRAGLEALLDRVLVQGRTVRQDVHDFGRPERRWWRSSWIPVRDASGQIEATVLLVADITRERQSEQHAALLAALAQDLEGSPGAPAVADAVVEAVVPELADVAVLQWLDPHGHAFGARLKAREAVPGADSADLASASATLDRVLDTGETAHLHVDESSAAADPLVRLLRQHGATEAAVVPLEAAGRVFGALAVARTAEAVVTQQELAVIDVMARRAGSVLEGFQAAATALRLELALEVADLGTFEWDVPSGRVDGDERLLRLLDVQPAGADPTLALLTHRAHPDDVDELRRELDRAAETGELRAAFRVVRGDGAAASFEVRGRALSHTGGRVERLVGTLRATTAG